MKSVSVCMATYNGSAYVADQLASILSQLSDDDEVIVCDDGSSDATVGIIQSFDDARIRLFENSQNVGYIKNFERALGLSSGKYIFLSDQDDIWPAGRVERMIAAMRDTGKMMVVGSTESFCNDIEDRAFFCGYGTARDSTYGRNVTDLVLGRVVPYFGSSMLISSELKSHILPFHSALISHDIWMFFVANRLRSICHLHEIVTYRRVHAANVSTRKRGMLDKVRTRMTWLTVLFDLYRR